MKADDIPKMQYRYLGPTGIKISVVSFGNWINSNTQASKYNTYDCIKKAWDLGVNFFDTAQVYGFGQAEIQMGEGLKKLNVPRHHYIVSTKLYFGEQQKIPNLRGLSRKHIIEGAKKSLKRLNMEYVDIIFCHRADYLTPMQQTCRSLDWLIRKGLVHYWGTSQWEADDIAEAFYICQKYGLAKPVAEQPKYNIYNRKKMQIEYRNIFKDKKMGTTIYSPLLNGILTGKYNNGLPQQSRIAKNPFLHKIYNQYFIQQKQKTLQNLNKFNDLAKQLNCTMAQLAIAWCINNPDVTTAITGASSPQQLQQTLRSVKVKKLLTKQIEKKIQQIFKTVPKGKMIFIKAKQIKSRRFKSLGYL